MKAQEVRTKMTAMQSVHFCLKVRKSLGIPKNLKQMTAGNVFDNYWRVNVWTEEPVAGEYSNLYTYKIKHSYFIKYDKELDRIIYSDPEIELTY